MPKTKLFQDRPLPPAVEVITRRDGTLDRLIKCPRPNCRGRHYESLITADDRCLSCGEKYVIGTPKTEDHLYVMYGGVKFHNHQED